MSIVDGSVREEQPLGQQMMIAYKGNNHKVRR